MKTLSFRALGTVLAALLAGASSVAGSALAPEASARVDELFSTWNRPDRPGCAVGVVEEGELVFARGYGMADLEHDIAISPASVFDIGSVSKQFTAASIVLLAVEGKLSLDDEIHRYLPELPAYPAPVAIRHL